MTEEKGYIDLHCHYLPGIDDGVRTLEDGIALCERLRSIGFATVVATPHIRTAMFENRRVNIEREFTAFKDHVKSDAALHDFPTLGVGAEHFFDDVFWGLLDTDEHVPYPGNESILVEFPPQQLPLGIDQRLFDLCIRGWTPVIAHPERYRPVQNDFSLVETWVQRGAAPLLDVMSLVGHYGSAPQRAAEELVARDVYYAACTDCHRPADVDTAARGIEALTEHIGARGVHRLFHQGPRALVRL